MNFPNIVLNGGDFHHMMDWWGIPFMGFWWIVVWIIQFVIAFFVYKDAEKRENNGLLFKKQFINGFSTRKTFTFRNFSDESMFIFSEKIKMRKSLNHFLTLKF